MRLAVIGSRTYADKIKISAALYRTLREHPKLHIISGGAQGADTFAQEWAEQNSVPYTVVRPIDPKRKITYLYRDVEIVTMADQVMAFWNGLSPGTRFTIEYAKARNKPIKVFT